MKDKIYYALTFVKEIIEYFECMPVLTNDEEALLESAENLKENLLKKEK